MSNNFEFCLSSLGMCALSILIGVSSESSIAEVCFRIVAGVFFAAAIVGWAAICLNGDRPKYRSTAPDILPTRKRRNKRAVGDENN